MSDPTSPELPEPRPNVASELLDLRDKPPEPLAPSPQALGVLELAVPTMIGYGTQTAVRMVDFAMVGTLGPEALAAVGLGGQIYWLAQGLGALVPTGLVAILARAIGAGNPGRADAALRQSILFATALGALTTLIGLPLTEEAIAIYGVEDGVVALGADYVFWLLWGTAPMSLALVFGAALRAAGDTRTPLWIGAGTNLLNVALNWVLIFGHLGAPALGVAGAALASTISMVAQLAVFAWLWHTRRLVLVPAGASWRPDPGLLRRTLTIGYPAAIEGMLFHLGLLWFQRLMSTYGTAAIAAYNVGAQILSLSFLPGIGFATAAATLVGQHLGAGSPDEAARSGWRSTTGAVLSMSAMGAIVVAFADPLAGLFTDDPETRALTVEFIWIFAAVQPVMAVEFATGGALRGAGDTVYPLIAVFVGLFLFRLVPATIAVYVFAAPLQWVWSALILDYAIKAVVLIQRFRRERWKTIEV